MTVIERCVKTIETRENYVRANVPPAIMKYWKRLSKGKPILIMNDQPRTRRHYFYFWNEVGDKHMLALLYSDPQLKDDARYSHNYKNYTEDQMLRIVRFGAFL